MVEENSEVNTQETLTPFILKYKNNMRSNTGEATWIASLKKSKIIHAKYHGKLEPVTYLLLEGTYLLISWYYHNKAHPMNEVTLVISHIYEQDGYEQFEEKTRKLTIKYNSKDDFTNIPEGLDFLRTLLNAIEVSKPGYHLPSTYIEFENEEIEKATIQKVVEYLNKLKDDKTIYLTFDE